MRHLLVFIAVSVMLMSCSLVPTASVEDFQMPEDVTTPMQAWCWVGGNIHYVLDSSDYYHIQTPAETMAKRTGDCKAYSALLAMMIHRVGGDAWIVQVTNTHGPHAVVFCPQISPQLIEPQRYCTYAADFTETSRMSVETYILLVDGGWQSY